MIARKLTKEYIRGLVEGKGYFTFSTVNQKNKKIHIPSFQLRMHIRDKELLEATRDFIGIKNKVYTYYYPGKDGYKRGPVAFLIVREFPNLKNMIIPLFYDLLAGHKGIQFYEWLEKIGSDPLVPESFKFLYRLHKAGFYKKSS